MSDQDIKRAPLNSVAYLTEMQQLSSLEIDRAIKFSEGELYNSGKLSTLAKFFSQASREALRKDGYGTCIVGHVKNCTIGGGVFPEYYVFDTFRQDGDDFDRDPVLIPIKDDGQPLGYVYRIMHNANDKPFLNKHIPCVEAMPLSSIPEDAPAIDISAISTYVQSLSAEFSDPISCLESQLSSVDAYWDAKQNNARA